MVMLLHRAHSFHLSIVISAQAEIQSPVATCHNLAAVWIPRFRGG
jgi:hypothetical protein